MDVFCLRVRKDTAGKTFPFDRVYLAKNGENGVFKKMFRYALILPVENSLTNLLLDYVEIEAGETHTFDRDDAAPAPTKEEFKEMLTSAHWVMCVPVLAKYVSSNLPRYLTAAGKYRDPTGKTRRRRRATIPEVAEPFPTMTYLQTPEQNIRPVCVACPNFINHQNGHCRLGEEICYTNLALGVHNHFKEGLDAPEQPPLEDLEEED